MADDRKEPRAPEGSIIVLFHHLALFGRGPPAGDLLSHLFVALPEADDHRVYHSHPLASRGSQVQDWTPRDSTQSLQGTKLLDGRDVERKI